MRKKRNSRRWCFERNFVIRHDCGATLTLVEGSWTAPRHIEPIFPESVGANDKAGLISDGLAYARYWEHQNCNVAFR
jgi:hypothetical protein